MKNPIFRENELSHISRFMEKEYNPYLKTFKAFIRKEGNKEYVVKQVGIILYDIAFFFDLSKEGLTLLKHVFIHQNRDKDVVELNNSEVRLSRSAYYRALRELEQANIIRLKEGNEYWTNMNLFFKGSVVRCYPNISEIKNKIEEENGEEERND